MSSVIFADYTSVNLSPSTGTIYIDNTAISVYVNSGSDEFAGVDINLGFTGSVEYVSSTGAARCTSFNVTGGTGTINIECLSIDHDAGETYSGLVTTLYFKSTGTGSSIFTFDGVDPTTTTKTGATYVLSSERNPDDSPSGLPDSGLFDESRSRIILGFTLLLIGIFFNRIIEVGYSFVGFVRDIKEKRSKASREEWEKKF